MVLLLRPSSLGWQRCHDALAIGARWAFFRALTGFVTCFSDHNRGLFGTKESPFRHSLNDDCFVHFMRPPVQGDQSIR